VKGAEAGARMLTFDEIVNKLKWTNVPLGEVVVGYHDRVEKRIFELPLPEFLESEIPRHRARYLKRGFNTLWDRR
jgi:uncharacterized protein (UPF0248 family)